MASFNKVDSRPDDGADDRDATATSCNGTDRQLGQKSDSALIDQRTPEIAHHPSHRSLLKQAHSPPSSAAAAPQIHYRLPWFYPNYEPAHHHQHHHHHHSKAWYSSRYNPMSAAAPAVAALNYPMASASKSSPSCYGLRWGLTYVPTPVGYFNNWTMNPMVKV